MSFLNKCFIFSLWFWWLDQHNKGKAKEYMGHISAAGELEELDDWNDRNWRDSTAYVPNYKL